MTSNYYRTSDASMVIKVPRKFRCPSICLSHSSTK